MTTPQVVPIQIEAKWYIWVRQNGRYMSTLEFTYLLFTVVVAAGSLRYLGYAFFRGPSTFNHRWLIRRTLTVGWKYHCMADLLFYWFGFDEANKLLFIQPEHSN